MLYRTLFILILSVATACATGAQETKLNPIEELGKQIFFDKNLSEPPGQACASCHEPAAGWVGENSEINAHAAVYPGALVTRSGNRKPPSAAYATQSPILHYDTSDQLFIGGNFQDGRATGWLLENPTAEQAQGPFLNPVEQNLKGAERVVELICRSEYGVLFKIIYGQTICNNTINAYNAIGQAVAAFEASVEVNAFSSKYDYYLKDPQKYPLTKEESLGLEIFNDEDKGNCAACHPSQSDRDGSPPLFTDFTYDNIGSPKNIENTWYPMPKEINPDGHKWIDQGLGGFLITVPRFAEYAEDNMGKHKVPTLRNVDKRPDPKFAKSYGHNGFFKSLKEIVHFYNVRDKLPLCNKIANPEPGINCWPASEVAENINSDELGDLGLTEEEEWALVAFMKTLSDGWAPVSR